MKKIFTFLIISLLSIIQYGTYENVSAREVCNDTDFYEYGTNVEYYHQVQTFQETKINPTDYPEYINRTVTQTWYAEAQITATVEVNAMVTKVGLEMGATVGTSHLEEVLVNFVIPPNSTRTVHAGYRYVSTAGVSRHYTMFCVLLSSDLQNGEWTYEGYSY